MKYSKLVCGPLVRYIDRTSAVIWLETDEQLEIEVLIKPLISYSTSVDQSYRSWAIRVDKFYYAWIHCNFLLPDTWYSYRIIGHAHDGSTYILWPDQQLSETSLPSAFRTLPSWSLDTLRIVFGSCRAGFPAKDPRSASEGLDALNALSIQLAKNWDKRVNIWPHLMLLTGDQIYADTLSQRLEQKFHSSDATTFSQFTEIYHEAWTETPSVRWLLSCIPSFMIFDDHEVVDDWNLSKEWVDQRMSIDWIRRISAALMAYWIYQGAGNISPIKWRLDERMRLLTPRFRPIMVDVTNHLERLFESYVRGIRTASWGYAIDAAGTRLVVGDTRMSRKLTGHRLLMNDPTWNEFTTLAKDSRSKRVLLVVPGPFLIPHPMHDLFSWIAEKIETDHPSLLGAVAGGLVGGLVAGPAGALIGSGIGAVAFEEIIDEMLGGPIEEYDVELWSAFPTSFNRMISLLEELASGIGTTRKHFVALLTGDVHYSNIMRGELLRTKTPASVFHFTMSPIRRLIPDEDIKRYKEVMVGNFPWYIDLISEVPDFVDKQMRRMYWYPLKVNGDKADPNNPDEWALFGTFLGWLELHGSFVTYRYEKAIDKGASGMILEELGRSSFITI